MGLGRVKTVYQNLHLQFPNAQIITITGTNGKGSTARALEQLALSLGKSTGVYASPHLIDYKERVRVNGEQVIEAEHCAAFSRVNKLRADTALTFFEFGTLAALQLISEHAPDVVILEVGLGGATDAVNVVDAHLAIITSIGLDHQEWLGDSRESVAEHKSGICRKNGLAVIGEPTPPTNLRKILDDLSVDSRWAGDDFSISRREGVIEYQGTHSIKVDCDATYPGNIASAITAAELLHWPLENTDWLTVFKDKGLPGRFQSIHDKPLIIVDVAHNPQATQLLRNRIAKLKFKQLHLVVGMLEDKDLAGTLQTFTEIPAAWYLASLHCTRGASAEVLESALSDNRPSKRYENVESAFQAALQAAETEDCVLVFGSFATVAEVLQVQDLLTIT